MRNELFLVVLAFALIASPFTAFGQRQQVLTMESTTAVLNVDSSSQPGFYSRSHNFTSETGDQVTPITEFFFEARIQSNASMLMVPAIILEINGTDGDTERKAHNISSITIYSSPHAEPIIYSQDASLSWFNGKNHNMAIIGTEPFPVIIPDGGILGIKFGMVGLNDGDQVKVTFVYLADKRSVVSAETIPVANVGIEPFYIEVFSEVEADRRFFVIDESYIDPENHCELCTRIAYEQEQPENGDVAYVTDEMHLEDVRALQFLARGEDGGETLIFKAAGWQAQNGTVQYSNITQFTLEKEWKRYEVGIPYNSQAGAADLHGITHLFALESNASSEGVIYLKGIIYR